VRVNFCHTPHDIVRTLPQKLRYRRKQDEILKTVYFNLSNLSIYPPRSGRFNTVRSEIQHFFVFDDGIAARIQHDKSSLDVCIPNT
jgi:hypothetical protein